LILADTSVWIDHLRSEDKKLQHHLNQGQIVIHPFIIAELALVSLKDRIRTLTLLDLLPQVRMAAIKRDSDSNRGSSSVQPRHRPNRHTFDCLGPDQPAYCLVDQRQPAP